MIRPRLSALSRAPHRLKGRLGRSGDGGFGLVELMVAIVVFGLLSAAAVSTLTYAMNTTRNDRSRVAAANLAARELEVVRNQFFSQTQGPSTIVTNQVYNPDPLPAGTAGAPLVVDNVAYTVSRNAQWTATGSGAAASPCDDGATDELSAMHVHVEVTWARMGSIPPVEADTLLTPPKGTYSSTTGHIGVKVVDRDGKPAGNHTVTVSGPSGTSSADTAEDGCALFAFLNPGTYTVSVSDPGFVDRQGNATSTQSVTVTGGVMTKANFDYDASATINATFVPQAGYALPSVMDLTVDLGNAGLPLGSMSKPGAGSPRTITSLWPFASGYQLWAGDCLDSDPQFTGQARANPVTATPGGTTSATIDLAALNVTVLRAGLPLTGVTVKAVHAADTSCATGDLVTLGTTDSLGKLKVAMPYGTWQIQVVGKSPLVAWPTVVAQRGAPPVSVTVVTL